MAEFEDNIDYAGIERELKQRTKRGLIVAGSIIHEGAVNYCPVGETSVLINSIELAYNDKEAVIFTNVEYGPYVELGTSKMEAQPFLTKSLRVNKNKALNAFARELKR